MIKMRNPCSLWNDDNDNGDQMVFFLRNIPSKIALPYVSVCTKCKTKWQSKVVKRYESFKIFFCKRKTNKHNRRRRKKEFSVIFSFSILYNVQKA